MKKRFYFITIILVILIISKVFSQEDGLIKKFMIKYNSIELTRIAQPNQYFDKTGQKAAVMGYENGSFEMWIWPWKVCRLMKKFVSLNNAELVTDWSIRSLSANPTIFDPMNYNYGAVWPFIGSFFTTAQYRYNYNLAAYASLESLINHAFEYGLREVPEVFSGLTDQKLNEAYHGQGFSTTGYMEPLMKDLLVLDVDAEHNIIHFVPHLPANWDSITTNHIKIGNNIVNLKFKKINNVFNLSCTSNGNDNIKVTFCQVIGLGARITSAFINDNDIKYSEVNDSNFNRILIHFKLKGKTVISLISEQVPEIFILSSIPEIGQYNQSLKIISQKLMGRKLHFLVEGLSGHTYKLSTTNPHLIKKIDGAKIYDHLILFRMDGDTINKFVKKNI